MIARDKRKSAGEEESRELEEGDIPHDKRSPFFRELIDIFLRYRITPIQPPLE